MSNIEEKTQILIMFSIIFGIGAVTCGIYYIFKKIYLFEFLLTTALTLILSIISIAQLGGKNEHTIP